MDVWKDIDRQFINELVKSRKEFTSVTSIAIPENLFLVFKKETEGRGYKCTWWGVPVVCGTEFKFNTEEDKPL